MELKVRFPFREYSTEVCKTWSLGYHFWLKRLIVLRPHQRYEFLWYLHMFRVRLLVQQRTRWKTRANHLEQALDSEIQHFCTIFLINILAREVYHLECSIFVMFLRLTMASPRQMLKTTKFPSCLLRTFFQYPANLFHRFFVPPPSTLLLYKSLFSKDKSIIFKVF